MNGGASDICKASYFPEFAGVLEQISASLYISRPVCATLPHTIQMGVMGVKYTIAGGLSEPGVFRRVWFFIKIYEVHSIALNIVSQYRSSFGIRLSYQLRTNVVNFT